LRNMSCVKLIPAGRGSGSVETFIA
jgi:hypothetical protein